MNLSKRSAGNLCAKMSGRGKNATDADGVSRPRRGLAGFGAPRGFPAGILGVKRTFVRSEGFNVLQTTKVRGPGGHQEDLDAFGNQQLAKTSSAVGRSSYLALGSGATAEWPPSPPPSSVCSRSNQSSWV